MTAEAIQDPMQQLFLFCSLSVNACNVIGSVSRTCALPCSSTRGLPIKYWYMPLKNACGGASPHGLWHWHTWTYPYRVAKQLPKHYYADRVVRPGTERFVKGAHRYRTPGRRCQVLRHFGHFHTFIPSLVLRYFVDVGRGMPHSHGGNRHFSQL